MLSVLSDHCESELRSRNAAVTVTAELPPLPGLVISLMSPFRPWGVQELAASAQTPLQAGDGRYAVAQGAVSIGVLKLAMAAAPVEIMQP